LIQDSNRGTGEKTIIKSCSWRRKKRNKILDSLSDPKKNVINIAGKSSLNRSLNW
jgi:hypothetical protein